MSTYSKKGIAVWILGFITFLAFLNAFNAALMWTLVGGNLEFEPYLIGQFTGRMQVTLYFWISAVTAFVFLGCTTAVAFRKPPLDPAIVEMFNNMKHHLVVNKVALDEHLEADMKSIQTIRAELLERMGTEKGVYEEFFQILGADLKNARKETLGAIEKEEKKRQPAE